MQAELVEHLKCFRVYVDTEKVPLTIPEPSLPDLIPHIIDAVQPDKEWSLMNCIWDDDVEGAVLIVFRILTDEYYKPFLLSL
jgi:hypothetical protein